MVKSRCRTLCKCLTVVQNSQSAIVNWQSFDIGQGSLVDIVQPNIDAAMLSRVVGNNLSEIHGALQANGHLYLINPNGILFGKDAQVDVHALIASTLDIADSAFLSGNISFDGNAEATVMNLGSIDAEDFAALIGGDLQNKGSITASAGSVAMLAADATLEVGNAEGGKITLDVSGLLGGNADNSGIIDVSSSTTQGGSVVVLGEEVTSDGLIDASGAIGGGEVLIGGDYQGMNQNLSNAVSTDLAGTINADATIDGDGGRVIIWADGNTDFSGIISVQGGEFSGNGGFVETSGKNLLSFTGSVDASAPFGDTGDLLLDPIDITITSASTNGVQNTSSTWESDDSTGSSILNVSDLLTSLSSANVTISTQQNATGQTAPAGGDITVSTAIDNSGNNNNLTLLAGEDISILSPITMGSSGDLTLRAGQRTDLDSGSVLAVAALTANDLTVEADTAITIMNAVVDSMNLTVNQTGGVNVSNTQAFSLTADSNNNNITASTSSGNLSIVSIDAGTGDVDLTASGGSVLDFTPSDDSSVNIIADTVTLAGSTGIGASGSGDVDTTAASLELSTTSSGNIFVADSDAVSLAASSTASNGSIDVRTVTGDLTVSSAVTTDGSGGITLNSAGNLVVNNVLTSTSGDISLTGATGVTHNAAGDLTTGGAGTITVNANANDVTMADGTVYTAGGGAVSVTGADEVLLGKISNPLGTVSVTATAGDISDETSSEGSSNENITGTTVTLSSSTGIGSSGAATDIDIAASTIVASDSGTGGIFLAETDDLAIGATSTTAGAISISAGGAVTTSGDVTAAGGALGISGVDLTNNNSITGDANGVSLDAGTGTLTSTAGNISNGSSAGSIVLAADTDIVLAGGAGAISGSSGDVTLKDSSGSVSIGVEGGAGTISLSDSDLDEITTSGAIVIGDGSSGVVTIGGAIQPSGAEAFQFGGSSVALNANVTTSNADITFSPAVTVGAGVTVDSGSGAGNITFSNTLDGGQALSLDGGTGTVNLAGAVGGNTPLTSLTVSAASQVDLGNVTTTGAVAITGTNIDLNTAAIVTDDGDVTFTGAVDLDGGAASVQSDQNDDGTDGNIHFTSTIDGAQTLSLDADGGTINLAGAIGGTTPLTSVTVSAASQVDLGNVTTTGAVAITGTNIDLNTAAIVTDDGDVTFTGAVDLDGGAASVQSDQNDDGTDGNIHFTSTIDGAQTLSLDADGGTINLAGAIGGTTPLTSVTVSAASQVDLGNVTTTGAVAITGTNIDLNTAAIVTDDGDVTFTGAVDLDGGAASVQSDQNDDGTDGNILFSSTIDGTQNLTLDADSGTITTNGNLGAVADLSTVDFSAATINLNADVTTDSAGQSYTSSTATNLGGSLTINTSGAFTFGGAGALTLTGDAGLTTPGGSGDDITLSVVVADADNSHDLTLNAGNAGNIDLTADLGTDGTRLENFIANANDLTISGSGAEVFANNISISVDTIDLDAAGTEQLKGSGTLVLKPRQDSTTIGIAGGAGTFNLDAADLGNLTDGFSSITIGSATQTGNITVNAHTFADPVTFLQNASGAGSLTIAGHLQNSGGGVTLTSGSGNIDIGDSLTTTSGDIDINGAVTLSGASTLTTNTSGAIDFSSTVDGGNDLTLASSGSTTFNGAVGATTDVGDGTGAAIIINSTGTTSFESTVDAASGLTQAGGAGSVTFKGDVTLADGDTATNLAGAVTLDGLNWSGYDGLTTGALTLSTAAVDINSQGGNIQFASIAGGSQDLSLNAGVAAGTTTVTGNVTALGDGTGAALTVDNSATGLVDFQGTFAGNSGLVAGAATSVQFAGDVTLADGDTATNLAGAVTLDGLNWSGYDGLTTGALTLSTAAVDINSQGGNIQFASIAGGSQDLSLNAGVAAGTTTVTGNVTALGDGTGAALTVDNSATGLVDFQGNFCRKQWFGGRSGDQRTVCRRCNFSRWRHRNEPSGSGDFGRFELERI